MSVEFVGLPQPHARISRVATAARASIHVTRVAGDATWMFILSWPFTFNFPTRSQATANTTCSTVSPLLNSAQRCAIGKHVTSYH